MSNGRITDKGSIAAWTGLVDSGSQLLKDCPCSCNRLQHKEDWEFKKVDYDFAKGKRINLGMKVIRTKTIDLRLIERCQKECFPITYTVKYTKTTTRKFASTTGIGLKIGTTISTGVPGIVKGEISIEGSIDKKFTYGKDQTESVAMSDTFTCVGSAKKFTLCVVLEARERIEVPYTMTVQHKTKGCICKEKGIYKREKAANAQQVATNCDGYLNPLNVASCKADLIKNQTQHYNHELNY